MSKSKQKGFTLVEVAIVLVIIGLLLGGILKGQEMINSARVKNMANDFRTIPLYVYQYQDKFRSLPGDDPAATAHVGAAIGGNGNGVIDGAWDSATPTDESFLFWQHVRLADLASGPTATTDAAYLPRNADGGRLGIQGGTPPIIGLRGSYFICSGGMLGKYAKQLDTTLDDGETSTGSMMTAVAGTNTPVTAATIIDSNSYTACLGF